MTGYARSDAKDAARKAFCGLWAATTTPFDGEGAMDLDALERDLDRLVSELEIDGIFCTGVMSEHWSLSVAERQAQVEAVVAATHGHCPVVAHTGHHSITETIGLTHHAERAGADFAVVIRPYHPPADEEGIYAFYAQVCAAVDIGVWIFDTSYAGPPLSVDLVSRLADIDNVCGIKVGHPHSHYLEVLAKVGDRILVCEPSESELLADMRYHGQRVHMSSAAPYLFQTKSSRPMLEYTRAALAGDFDQAAAISSQMAPVRELADKWLHRRWRQDRVNPVPWIKAWAALLGMSGGPPRAPLCPPPAADLDALAAELEQVGLIG